MIITVGGDFLCVGLRCGRSISGGFKQGGETIIEGCSNFSSTRNLRCRRYTHYSIVGVLKDRRGSVSRRQAGMACMHGGTWSTWSTFIYRFPILSSQLIGPAIRPPHLFRSSALSLFRSFAFRFSLFRDQYAYLLYHFSSFLQICVLGWGCSLIHGVERTFFPRTRYFGR